MTDFEVDRIIIDKAEAWHKERHQEIFYTYKSIDKNEARRQLQKSSYVELMIKEISERDLKQEPRNREGAYRRIMLTLDQRYNNDKLTNVQRLLSY